MVEIVSSERKLADTNGVHPSAAKGAMTEYIYNRPQNETRAVAPAALQGDKLLPSEARRKYQQLLRDFTGMNASFSSLSEEVEDVRRRLRNAKVDPSRKNEVPVLEEDLADIKARFSALEGERGDRGQLAAQVRDFVENLTPGMKVVPAERVVLKKAPANFIAEVGAVRERIQELKDEADRVRALPIPASEAKLRARQQIVAEAARGRPDASILHNRPEAGLRWPQTYRGADDLGALICWLHRDAMIVAVDAEIDRVMGETIGISDHGRADKLAEIARVTLCAERTEEALIELAASSGISVIRRPDASPLAVLGVSVEGMRVE
jgi:hypothetical protein